MKSLLAALTLTIAVTALPAAAQTQTKLSASDTKFLREAAGGGLGEVQLGQLAASKATSDEVKQFGQRMVQDHGKAADQLKAAAAQEGLNVPTTVAPDAKKSYVQLSKLSGDRFDRAYMKDMVADHRKDVKLFQDEATNGKDPALKQFAQQTLPTIQDHLAMAERLAQ